MPQSTITDSFHDHVPATTPDVLVQCWMVHEYLKIAEKGAANAKER